MNPMQWMETPETCLAEIAGGHGLVESLLDLVVDELDECIILLREFLLEDLVIFCPDLLHPFSTHPLSNHAHLLECKYGLLRILTRSHCKAAAGPFHHVCLHHWLR